MVRKKKDICMERERERNVRQKSGREMLGKNQGEREKVRNARKIRNRVKNMAGKRQENQRIEEK